jgi:hypothetical protein
VTAPAVSAAVPDQPPKKKRGRTPKLTEEVMARILAELSRGVFFTIACKLAGVSPSIGYTWRANGRTSKKGTLVRQFSESCVLAEATAEARLGDVVWDAATKEKSAKIALAMLGRRFPKRWSARRLLQGEIDHRHQGELDHRHLHGVVLLPAEDLGKDSLPVEQVLVQQGMSARLAASRIPASVPPTLPADAASAQDAADDQPEPQTAGMRPWNPTRRKHGQVTDRARQLLEEMGEDDDAGR